MVDKNYFFMLSYPRSMTAWFSVFLTWGDAFCYHELTTREEDWETTLRNTDASYVGMTDPGNILRYDELKERFPDAQFFALIRDREDVRESFESVYDDQTMIEQVLHQTEKQLSRLPYSIPRFKYERINEHTLHEVWNHVTKGDRSKQFSFERAEKLLRMRVEATYVERV